MFKSVNTTSKEELMKAADDMAMAATTFKGQGYTIFLESRDNFKKLLDSFIEK